MNRLKMKSAEDRGDASTSPVHPIAARPSNRYCVVKPLTRFDRGTIQREIEAGREVCEDFVTLEAGLSAANKTRFKAYRVGRHLVLAICVMDRGNPGARNSEQQANLLHVMFDPYHDHVGYFDVVLTADGPPSITHFLPYEANRSTSFPPLRVVRWEWIRPAPPSPAEEPDWVFVWFELGEVFRAGPVCGFNVGRGNGGTNEYSSWNPRMNLGFGEAVSMGHLRLRPPMTALGPVNARLVKDRLRISGTWPLARKGRMVLLDPLGGRLPVKPRTGRDGVWFAELPLRAPRGGRYRLLPVGHRREHCEPDWLAFDLPSRTPQPFTIGMVYDFPDDFGGAPLPYTPRALADELDLFHSCGIRRIHWLDYAPDAAVWHIKAMWPSRKKVEATRRNCGDLLPLAVKLAHERGMEFTVFYKPFDLAFHEFPIEPSQVRRVPHKAQTIENHWVALPPDLAAHQDCTMHRHPEWGPKGDVPTELCFYSREMPVRLTTAEVHLFESADNRAYTPYRRGFTLRQGARRRGHLAWTPAGNVSADGAERNGYIELSGLRLRHPYLTIEVRRKGFRMAHREHAMVEAFDAGGRAVAVTLAASGTCAAGFHWKPISYWGNRTLMPLAERAWAGDALGMAFRLPLGQPTLLEPASEGSRRIWLDGVRRALEAGADGVSIRTLFHHNRMVDYTTYAYAESVRRSFRECHGREVTPTFEDGARIRRLRGEGYTEFMRQASRLTRQHGKKFAAHFECGVEIPPELDQPMQFNLDWKGWMTEGLLDEVFLKWCGPDYPFAVDQVLPLARRMNIAVHLIESNGSMVRPFRRAECSRRMMMDARAAGYAGIHLYEAAGYKRRNHANKPYLLANTESALREAARAAGVLS